MKKTGALLLALSLMVSAFVGCASGQAEPQGQTETAAQTAQETQSETAGEPMDVNVVAMKGPTAMGMVQFMDEADKGNVTTNNYNFSIAASADEVTPMIAQGTADIAAVPANLASVLYNNTDGGVRVLAINTLGVLYIVETGDGIQSVADLEGKTIYASGKGSTPEYALNYVLKQNGLDPSSDVTIEWMSEQTECVAALANSEDAIAMLPQPFVTTAQSKNSDIRVALDLTEEWDALQENAQTPSTLCTGVVVARTEFAEEHPEVIRDFLDKYEASVAYVNENVDAAAALVGQYDIVTEEVAKTALPECHIVCITGDEMKEKLSGYLSVLAEENAQSVGGTLPADDFYYSE
ncbi:MAG TPA: ABC transporter substrate-binding protein [Candidatus Onthocola gallistercoris]|uniref:ABC transporter substrate-binding protein n=1 Tax=Candidatus Onthocola gallistercoris TaxID=2840876 RepID=A0A9D1HFQ1_9FIRM|nr:ABC transporter substrate-binding protein [Candidatus Onthocola gallistercoris]